MLKIQPLSVGFFVERLDAGEPFAFVRYGNGEWHGIFETAARTGSGSQSLRVPGLASELAASVRRAPRDKRYILGMQSAAYLKKQLLWKHIVIWLRTSAPNLTWYEADVLHKASMHGQMFPLIQAVRKHKVVVIGPEHLKRLHKILPYERFIPVKSRDCYTQRKQVLKQVHDCKHGSVFLISAGPMAKVLIWQAFKTIGEHSFLIDTGSLWDPYCGKRSRRYHARVRGAILRQNVFGV